MNVNIRLRTSQDERYLEKVVVDVAKKTPNILNDGVKYNMYFFWGGVVRMYKFLIYLPPLTHLFAVVNSLFVGVFPQTETAGTGNGLWRHLGQNLAP